MGQAGGVNSILEHFVASRRYSDSSADAATVCLGVLINGAEYSENCRQAIRAAGKFLTFIIFT